MRLSIIIAVLSAAVAVASPASVRSQFTRLVL